MTFLYAAALGLAVLAAVPVALHFRRRDTTRRVAFPALRYLSRAEDASVRSSRLRDLALLAVRVGLILALAAAAAGPLIGRGGASDHPPTDVAVVIDNSASTGRLLETETVLDRLLDRARASLGAAGPEDRVWVFPTVGAPLAAGVAGPEAVAALDAVRQTDAAADLVATVGRAGAVLSSFEERRAEVQLLSDLQATSLGSPSSPAAEADRDSAAEPALAGSVPLVVYEPGALPEVNGAVTSLTLSPGPAAPVGVRRAVLFRVERSGQVAADSSLAVVRLEVDGRTAGGARVAWGSEAALPLPPLAPGIHEGRVEIDPSGLRSDDARYFTVTVTDPPVVSVRGAAAEGFLRAAVETLREGGRISTASGPVTTIILEGTAGLAESPASEVEHVVLVPPADAVDLAAFNQRLRELGVPRTVRPDTSRGELRLGEGAGSVPGLAEVRVTSRYRLEESGARSDTVLIRAEDGEAWAVLGRASGLRFLLIGSPLTAGATTLPTSPAMIPFVEWCLFPEWLARPDGASSLTAGSAFPLPPRTDSIRLADGGTERAEGGAPFTPLRAGGYVIHGSDGGPIAVNVPAAESDLQRGPAGSIPELFPGREVIIAGPDEDEWEGAVFRARRGVDSAPWFLLVALGLAVAESALATPGRSSGREVSEVSITAHDS